MLISSNIKPNAEFLDLFNRESVVARQDKITVDGKKKTIPNNIKDRAIMDSIDASKRMDRYSDENYKRANGTYSHLKPKF